MRKFFSVISKVIAGVLALFFVITAILAIISTDINEQVFSSTIYKNAMVEQNIYVRLPEIVGVAITSNFLSYPCAQKPLACSIDGASPQLKACLTSALGTVAYEAIGSGRRSPTSTELQKAQSCLDRYGNKQETNSQPATTEGGMPPFMKNLTAADWQAILTIILPPDTLKTMTESTLDQMFAYLNGQVNTVAVPLEKLKERLLGPAGKVLILQLLNSQQPCSEQNLEQLIIGDASSGMVLCKPPEDMVPIVSAVLPDLLNSIVPQIPDKAIIIKPPAAYAATPGTGAFGSDPIATIHTVRLVMRLSPLVPLALLLLVSLFAVRSLISWMRWWGIPFVVSGLATLVLGLLAVPALNMVWTRLIVPRIPVYIPTDISGAGLELLRSIVHGISGWIIYSGIFLFVVGLTGWIGSYYIKIKRKPEAPNASPMPSS